MEWRSLAMEQLQRAVNSAAAMAFAVGIAVILTIVAVGYQPPDPVFQVSRSMARVFNTLHNATFEVQGTVVVTGEDAVALAPMAFSVEIVGGNSTDPGVSDPAKCDPGTTTINCSEPGVLAAIEIANEKKFPDMGTFEYGPVVRGSSGGSTCDISWKYTTRNERSPRTYRDYREYTLLVNSSCDYVVEKIGSWHSGKNARWRQVDSINDTLFNRSANTFWSGSKYLYYSGSGDHCKSMSQYLWSLLCALGEARYLKRTLVMNLELCLSAGDNPGRQQDEPGKDFRLYFDYDHLRKGAAVVDQKQFLKRWFNWNKKHPHNPVSYRVIDDTKVSPVELADEPSSIVWRRFDPNSYWYRVCEGEAEKVIQRPWELVWKSKRVMNVVNAICGEMEWDFDAVHVVRGSKAENREKWPNLDQDTMPEEILKKLDGVVESGRRLYIATNEMLDGYFDKLREKYRVFLLRDFSNLWAPNSQWFNETKALLGPSSGKNRSKLEFDGYMRVQIDSEIFLRAKKRVETFGELTSDCKHGINSC